MIAFPQFNNSYEVGSYGFTGGTTHGTAVTSGGTNNTKGSWVEFVSSLPRTCTGIYVHMEMWDASSIRTFFDIGVGSAGSEQVVVENGWWRNQGSSGRSYTQFFPVSISAGQRVAVRTQTSNGNKSPSVVLRFVYEPGAYPTFAGCSSIGHATGNTELSGSTATNGVTTHTKTAYAEVTASTARDYRALLVVPSTIILTTDMLWSIDVAIGGAGSEQIILADFQGYTEVDEEVNQESVLLYLPIPAGTRLAWRYQHSRAATNNYIMCGFWGFY